MGTARPLTEAEQERAIRDRIDRIARLREEYAARRGEHPEDARLPATYFDRLDREAPEGKGPEMTTEATIDGMRGRVLEACKRLADGKPIAVSRIQEELGAGDDKSRKAVYNAIYQLKQAHQLPYAIESGRGGRPKGSTKPKPSSTGNGPALAPPGPSPRPVAAVEPDAHNPARLAELAADLCRTLDGLTEAERTFALAFVRHRYT